MVDDARTTVLFVAAAAAATGVYVYAWRRQSPRADVSVFGLAARSLPRWVRRTLAEGARGDDACAGDGGNNFEEAPPEAATGPPAEEEPCNGTDRLCNLEQERNPSADGSLAAEEEAPQRLLQARAGLALAFKEAFEDKSGGFRIWWNQADAPAKMKLLRGARVLVERRLVDCGMGGVLCLLCPEVSEKSLPSMFHSLPGLIQGRINNVYAVKSSDRAFVRANCDPGADPAKVETTVYNRQLLMAIFFTDVLRLYKHLSHGVIAGC